MIEELKVLVAYRIEEAQDALKAGRVLCEQRFWRDSCNRSYYAMFYAVLALLATRSMGTSKHAGAIALFDREFVKAGMFQKEMSEGLHKVFRMRLEADYDGMSRPSKEDAEDALAKAENFLVAVTEHLRQGGRRKAEENREKAGGD